VGKFRHKHTAAQRGIHRYCFIYHNNYQSNSDEDMGLFVVRLPFQSHNSYENNTHGDFVKIQERNV